MAMLEFGLYFMTYLTVQNASREGARMASTLTFLEENDSRVISFVEGLIPDTGPFSSFVDGTTNTAVEDCEVNDQITVTVTGQYNPVALGFTGLGGIDLTFPSTTHYELCGAYAGTTPDPGATNTPIPSNTSQFTNTPSPTPSPTASPTPSCQVEGGAIDYDGDDIRWNLTNNGTSTERISSVSFDWIDSPSYNYYDHMRFGGSIIHYGNDNSPPTTVSGGWSGWSGYRDLSASQTKELNIDFRYSHPGYGVTITVEFESGCIVSSGSAPGPTDTDVPTNTPLPSDTPTASNTPTNTATASVTPTAEACAVEGGVLDYDGDDIRWDLTNNGGATERITNVYFDWIDSPYYNYFSHLNFGGQRIHDGNDYSPPTNISGGWYGSAFRRDLAPSQTKELNIDFRYSHPNYGVSITVEFESGCTVSTN